MTDQDLDGSHIKGLGINLFQSEWPTLAQMPGFIGFMNTPILKAKKGSQELVFYNEGEFEQWKKSHSSGGGSGSVVGDDVSVPAGWSTKYYKGLGTSTGKEFKEYFERKKVVSFEHSGQLSDNAIDMVFNKKRADDRKQWLAGYNRDSYLDTNTPAVSYEQFIDRELIHFSKYDCDRSIPNLMDGQKISLRKILFAAFKKGLKTEIKVAQFSGYVSEHSGYHHGEASLNGAIVGMAQNFVGSNNINLFEPNGQFGTRLQGGKDSASERYIFTQLNKLTRLIFRQEDDAVLTYLNDDGQLVEPIHYVPIIPMILVNGTKGIGTGFSTDIMCYHPLQIIQYIKGLLTSSSPSVEIEPYYEGFRGTIQKIGGGGGGGGGGAKYLIKGTYEIITDRKVRITELPVGTWTDDYKAFLEGLLESPKDKDGKDVGKPSLREYTDLSTDATVDITVTLMPHLNAHDLVGTPLDNGCNALEKLLDLFTTQSTTNMHLFDHKEKLKKYNDIYEIVRDYYEVRLEFYGARKVAMLAKLANELRLLSNRARYIQELLQDKIDLRRKTKNQIVDVLKSLHFECIDGDDEYKYLTKMPMDSVSDENVEKLLHERDAKSAEHEVLMATSHEKLWLNDLTELEREYVAWKSVMASPTTTIATGANRKIMKKVATKN
jgi:DNA topoisomerase-2